VAPILALLAERAAALAKRQDFGAESLRMNLELVTANEGDLAARNRLARCYCEAGILDEAEAQYREVLQRDRGNRIAAGGLGVVERLRRRRSIDISDEELRKTPLPERFVGFGLQEFAELELCREQADIEHRFAPRVLDLVKRINQLPVSVEIASLVNSRRTALFRIGKRDVHPQMPGHWYIFNLGGRWEPQFNLGMFGGEAWGGDWLRVGIGFNLTSGGMDPDGPRRVPEVRAHFRRLQALLGQPANLFVAWMTDEQGLIQIDGGGPWTDLTSVSGIAERLRRLDPERTEWVFFGKWLSPNREPDGQILRDPARLIEMVRHVFAGLLPLWQEIRTPQP
jgi:hypothetical protein